jgi:hypothetical protein
MFGSAASRSAPDLAERLRDLAVQMRLTRVLGLEGVEDPVRRVVDLERVPVDRPGLAPDDLTTTPQECSQVISFSLCALRKATNPSHGHDEAPSARPQ